MTRKAAALETLLAAAMVIVALTTVVLPVLGPGGLELVLRGPAPSVAATLVAPVPGLPSLEHGPAYEPGDSVELGGQAVVRATVLRPSVEQELGLTGGTVAGGVTARGITLTELAGRVGITLVNLSVLKNGRGRAIRSSTLAALCRELDCQPGDLLAYDPRPSATQG